MLITPGGAAGFLDPGGERARRTAVAQDGNGRILFILATSGSLTLNDFTRYLAESDLELQVALNLDGGSSSGLLLAEPAEGIVAYSPLPTVITVSPR